MKNTIAANIKSVPEALTKYLYEIMQKRNMDKCRFVLSSRPLANGLVQDIVAVSDNTNESHTVFGFAPVDGVLDISKSESGFTFYFAPGSQNQR